MKSFYKKYLVICCKSVVFCFFVVQILSSKHVQNDLCTFLKTVFGQCVDLKKIHAETTSKYFFEKCQFYIYEIPVYIENFDVFRILLTKELQSDGLPSSITKY
jgi:hypothetical protein